MQQFDRHDRKRVIICGAAGRDFHNFNVALRDDPETEVLAFTATQIPGIEGRTYPPELAGHLYPRGIPIAPESQLTELCRRHAVDEVVFAYSDVDHAHVMRLGATALAAGADFTLMGPRSTMIEASVPVISICAVRTGCGKSQIARYLSGKLGGRGVRTAAMRHPMPYGDLTTQRVQRLATLADLDAADCTLEEREEYEPHIAAGGLVFTGVDYAAILERAEQEAELILWDGGNNDFPFIRPDYSIVVVDALRPSQLDTHYPGAAVLKMADLVVVNKVRAATGEQLAQVRRELQRLVPDTPHLLAASPVTITDPDLVRGARVLIVEDGPTITHGGMPHGAGFHAVQSLLREQSLLKEQDLDVAEIVDPRASATPEIAEVYAAYPHIGPVLPAMGYGDAQRAALAATIEAAAVDVVVAGTPIDFARAVSISTPVVRVGYAYQDAEEPGLMSYVEDFLASQSH